ncbi:MAG: hypothetical protein KAS63_01160 [Candidatus Heimdallarchaeota archaeon]|nr:hypothetical protein [Candidatus Heimdallarchaeota archaeon]MCK4953951.1 hypothetical protein [Candidatus Heimdallarchaeota archaeon]
MSYDIKFGIIQELEEKLSETLAKWLENSASKSKDQEDKKMLIDLLQGAEEVLNRWL